jgi:hypothetical protein
LWRRAPQQKIRTHRSLNAYCATLVMKIKRKMISYFFLIYPSNGAPVEWNWRENRSTRGKTCPSDTLSTTNPTWTDPGIEPGPPRWEAGLSHGTALLYGVVDIKAVYNQSHHLPYSLWLFHALLISHTHSCLNFDTITTETSPLLSV